MLNARQQRLQAKKREQQALIVANIGGRKICKLVAQAQILAECAKLAKKANALYAGYGSSAFGPSADSWHWSR